MEKMANPAKTLVPEREQDNNHNTVVVTPPPPTTTAPLAPTGIGESDYEGIFEHVVVEVVVRSQSHNSSPTDGQGVEGLSGSVFPHLRVKRSRFENLLFFPARPFRMSLTGDPALSLSPARPSTWSNWTGNRCRTQCRLWLPLASRLGPAG